MIANSQSVSKIPGQSKKKTSHYTTHNKKNILVSNFLSPSPYCINKPPKLVQSLCKNQTECRHSEIENNKQ